MTEENTQKPRRELSPEHMEKLQAARAAAAASRKRAEAPARRDTETKSVRDVKDRPSRAERRPFGGANLKLWASERPGYHRCWMNDEGNTLQEAENAWYKYVEEHESSSNTGTKVRKLVGTKEGGAPLYAYLMEIEQDLWEEDQAEIAKRVRAVDESIGRIKDGVNPKADTGKFYGEVRVTRS